MENHNQYQRVVPFIVFVLALFLFFKLIQPMITILLGSFLLAYISFPVYRKIIKRIPNKSISIIFSLAIVLLIIAIPFTFLTFEIIQHGSSFYKSLSNGIAKGALFGLECTSSESKVCSLLNQVEKFSLERLSVFGFDKQIEKFLTILEEKITKFILSLPIIIAGIFLSIVIAYFIMKDWKNLLKKIFNLLPMSRETKKRLIKEFGNIAHTVIYAQLFVAFIQGVIGTIGLYIFSVPFPIFFGVLIAFCALIPAIGTAIIWAPIALFLILMGSLSNDYWLLFRGIGLLAYGTLIISTIDNILLAKIVHTRTKVSQIIVIVGVIGGASLFGFVGIFIGPILLLLLITYFETFKKRFT